MSKKKGEKMNDYKPEELEEVKTNTKKLNERVDALAELLSDLEKEVKEIKTKTYPGDIANAIREGFGNLTASAPIPVDQPASAPAPPGFQFDIFSIGWLQKGMAQAPANPQWGWAFGFTQNGEYRQETEKLVKYLEKYKTYSVGDYTVSLGGNDNKLLRLNKKRT